MSLKIFLDQTEVYACDRFAENKFTLNFVIYPPQTLTLLVDGKQTNDTQVDISGNIIEDMFVKVDRLSINKIPITPWILESKFFDFENRQGQISHSNYFGQNGKTQIVFGDDLLRFFLQRLLCS